MRPQGWQYGLLAQEQQAMCPEACHETDDGLVYDQTALNGILIQLCRELCDEVAGLKAKLNGKYPPAVSGNDPT